MADEVNVEIVEDEITVSVEGTSTWDSLTGKPTATAENDFIVADAALAWVKKTLAQVKTILGLGTAAFQNIAYFALAIHQHAASGVLPAAFTTQAFANPLTFDLTTSGYYDFITTITGDTVVHLTNVSNGMAGMLKLIIDAVGGYAVTLDATEFVDNLNSGTIDNTANAINYISYRAYEDGKVAYTILQKT